MNLTVYDARGVAGAMTLTAQGLYLMVDARCELPAPKVVRLYGVRGFTVQLFGVLQPEGGQWVLHRAIPAASLPVPPELGVLGNPWEDWLPWRGRLGEAEVPYGFLRNTPEGWHVAVPQPGPAALEQYRAGGQPVTVNGTDCMEYRLVQGVPLCPEPEIVPEPEPEIVLEPEPEVVPEPEPEIMPEPEPEPEPVPTPCHPEEQSDEGSPAEPELICEDESHSGPMWSSVPTETVVEPDPGPSRAPAPTEPEVESESVCADETGSGPMWSSAPTEEASEPEGGPSPCHPEAQSDEGSPAEPIPEEKPEPEIGAPEVPVCPPEVALPSFPEAPAEPLPDPDPPAAPEIPDPVDDGSLADQTPHTVEL